MQNVRANVETYLQSDGKWVATIWICRKFYKAEGATKEAAVAKLKFHLVNLIPIYENTIAWTKDIINGINDFISKSPAQD